MSDYLALLVAHDKLLDALRSLVEVIEREPWAISQALREARAAIAESDKQDLP